MHRCMYVSFRRSCDSYDQDCQRKKGEKDGWNTIYSFFLRLERRKGSRSRSCPKKDVSVGCIHHEESKTKTKGTFQLFFRFQKKKKTMRSSRKRTRRVSRRSKIWERAEASFLPLAFFFAFRASLSRGAEIPIPMSLLFFFIF